MGKASKKEIASSHNFLLIYIKSDKRKKYTRFKSISEINGTTDMFKTHKAIYTH